MISKAKMYRGRADETRAMADCMNTDKAKKLFMEIAERYERMAEAQDRLERRQQQLIQQRKDTAG